jgi:hypothetical protein
MPAMPANPGLSIDLARDPTTAGIVAKQRL